SWTALSACNCWALASPRTLSRTRVQSLDPAADSLGWDPLRAGEAATVTGETCMTHDPCCYQPGAQATGGCGSCLPAQQRQGLFGHLPERCQRPQVGFVGPARGDEVDHFKRQIHVRHRHIAVIVRIGMARVIDSLEL